MGVIWLCCDVPLTLDEQITRTQEMTFCEASSGKLHHCSDCKHPTFHPSSSHQRDSIITYIITYQYFSEYFQAFFKIAAV